MTPDKELRHFQILCRGEIHPLSEVWRSVEDAMRDEKPDPVYPPRELLYFEEGGIGIIPAPKKAEVPEEPDYHDEDPPEMSRGQIFLCMVICHPLEAVCVAFALCAVLYAVFAVVVRFL